MQGERVQEVDEVKPVRKPIVAGTGFGGWVFPCREVYDVANGSLERRAEVLGRAVEDSVGDLSEDPADDGADVPRHQDVLDVDPFPVPKASDQRLGNELEGGVSGGTPSGKKVDGGMDIKAESGGDRRSAATVGIGAPRSRVPGAAEGGDAGGGIVASPSYLSSGHNILSDVTEGARVNLRPPSIHPNEWKYERRGANSSVE